MTKNNHYISRYLTRPWEWKKGMVRVFDFRAQAFDDRDTQNLFAKESLFSQSQEEFFNQFIETAAVQALKQISAGIYKTSKWKTFRALTLLMWDLVARHAAASGDHSMIKYQTSLNSNELSQYALAIQKLYKFSVFNLPGDSRLFFPSIPLLSYLDPTTGDTNFGVPVSGSQALFMCKIGSDYGYADELCKGYFFSNLSVGNDKSEFCIIHPDLIGQQDNLPIMLNKIRKDNNKQATDIYRLRQMTDLAKAFEVQSKPR